MKEKLNLHAKELWGVDSLPDISAVFASCVGYASCPGWAFIRRTVENLFDDFNGLKTIELGCGAGKVSLLFSLLGAKTTLVDYSPKQLKHADYIAEKFQVQPVFIKENILQLPKSFWGQYDISMSFGSVEHFFLGERQAVFDAHYNMLRKGGLGIIWAPNRYGLLFHLGVAARKLFKREVCPIDETSFTRKGLFRRARESGFSDIKIVGGELLINDFNNHVLNIRRLLRLPSRDKAFTDARQARNELLQRIAQNNIPIQPWNNLFSYPLILIGIKI